MMLRNKLGILLASIPFLCLAEAPAKKEEPVTIELLPCNVPLKASGSCVGSCSLQEWAKKIETLKERPIEFSSLPSKKNYQRSILSLSEFMGTLQAAATTLAKNTCNNKAWLGKQSLYAAHPELYTLDRSFTKPAADVKNFPFKPYTRRLITQPGSEIIMFGDLHGSIHSFIRDLEKLQSEGLLDNSFALTKKNSFMVFLGDYIDRGIYGVEVIYTLARLILANPTQVIVVRGNHEDYILAPDFRKKHTKQEQKDNAPSFIDELYLKFDLSEKDEVALFRFYEILPIALYIGSGTAFHTDFIQCCHGGMEIGYNPYKLLNAPKAISFERIETFWRKKYFSEKLGASYRTMITDAFDPAVLKNDIQDMQQEAPFFKLGTSGHVAYNGFMWNDFYVDPLKTVGQRRKKFTGWVYGKALTHELLSWANSKKVTFRGVMRGHQHNNETGGPMLNLLCCARGIVDVWHDRSVYTLVSAPDSKLEDTGEECFTYDSFVVLKVASTFKEWQIRHYVQDNGMENKEWKIKELLAASQKMQCAAPLGKRENKTPRGRPVPTKKAPSVAVA